MAASVSFNRHESFTPQHLGYGESGNEMRGMRGMGVGMQGIGVGMQGIWVGMWGMGVGMCTFRKSVEVFSVK